MSSNPNPPEAAAVYSGRFRHVLDRSHRVSLPSKWRTPGSTNAFYIIQWPVGVDRHLLVLPPERWGDMYGNLRKYSLSDPRTTALLRQIGSTHSFESLDKVGRLPLTEQLARSAGLGDEALLIGMLDRFEIWSPVRYAEVEEENRRLAAEAFQQITL